MTTTRTTIDSKVTQMTAAQLLGMPDDGYRHELVLGELRTMSSTAAMSSPGGRCPY